MKWPECNQFMNTFFFIWLIFYFCFVLFFLCFSDQSTAILCQTALSKYILYHASANAIQFLVCQFHMTDVQPLLRNILHAPLMTLISHQWIHTFMTAPKMGHQIYQFMFQALLCCNIAQHISPSTTALHENQKNLAVTVLIKQEHIRFKVSIHYCYIIGTLSKALIQF